MGLFDWLRRSEAPKDGDEVRGREEAPAAELEARVVAVLRTVYDPEIPINIYDLGLIYGLEVDEAHREASIRMTLTAPGCPVAQTFPGTVARAVESVEGIDKAHVELVWDPPWSRERMSEAARLELGI